MNKTTSHARQGASTSNRSLAITDTEIRDACSELEDALLTLLEERDNQVHYDASKDLLKTLGQMADALIYTEEHDDD